MTYKEVLNINIILRIENTFNYIMQPGNSKETSLTKKNNILAITLTLVLLKGVATTPLTAFVLVLKIAQPRGKIAPGTFKFILSLHFREKIPNLPPTPGVG